MADKLETYYRRQTVAACLELLPSRLKRIQIAKACEMLAKLGHEDEVFWWLSFENDGKRYEWTAKKLCYANTDSQRIDRWPASEINVIEFLGGPPDRFKIHTGTFLTFLIDRLLLAIEKEGLIALDRVLAPDEIYA
jgi:hypothetical protein